MNKLNEQISRIKLIMGLSEAKVYPYTPVKDSRDGKIEYRFDADGIMYTLSLFHFNDKHDYGVYEAEFKAKGQGDPAHRVGRDIVHLNNVLYTSAEIIEKVVKERKIGMVMIDPSNDDENLSWRDLSLRGQVYVRFFKSRYPADALRVSGNKIYIDMTKIFPNVFGDMGEDRVKAVVGELVRISDNDPDEEGIMRGLSGTSNGDFVINTDYIENSVYGNVYVSIVVNDRMMHYGVEFQPSEGEYEDESFRSFDELIKYLKTK